MKRKCKLCKSEFTAYNTIQNKCFTCTRKTSKPIPKRGKVTQQYEKWRDLIARPHLIRTQGNLCQNCGRRARAYHDNLGNVQHETLDVAHIIGRGRDASKRMDIDNVRLLCRSCHRKETDGK